MAYSDDSYVLDILRLEGLLRAYLHRFAPKSADLEDLLQETYARLLSLPSERRLRVDAIQRFALTTARNVAIDWMRRRRVVPIDAVEDLDSLYAEHCESRVDEIVNAHQELLRLAAVVAELPARCAEVFTLRKVYGWSQKEIANHFGISISTVEAHLVKAVKRCAAGMAADTPGATRAPESWLQRWRRRARQ
ncbi:sigma-70 family RNA polymerase sigma factor [Peristeroidobacter soli]|uniref:sigma-70 family RNA polymerase sigma factor n=1 Tax=Peristeroidobacter soli TaxID=2497877 RepID=UPI00101CC503|nr:sigma-70 family RNA polymerase sigma factor [Peristeroidobacter soli]